MTNEEIETEFRKINEEHRVLREMLEGTTDKLQKLQIMNKIAFNNGKMEILKQFLDNI